MTRMPCACEPGAEQSRLPVNEDQREPDDDRRDREREIDERIEHAPPAGLPRTSTSAQPTPKTVLRGTAIAAISSVSQKALIAAGVVTHDQAVAIPCSKVLMNTTPSGSTSRSVRYVSAITRSDSVVGRLMRNCAPSVAAQREQDRERDDEQHREIAAAACVASLSMSA